MERNRCTSHLVLGIATLFVANSSYEGCSPFSSVALFNGLFDSVARVCCRYVTAERYSEALDVLDSGAGLQLETGQVILYASFDSPPPPPYIRYIYLILLLNSDILHLC